MHYSRFWVGMTVVALFFAAAMWCSSYADTNQTPNDETGAIVQANYMYGKGSVVAVTTTTSTVSITGTGYPSGVRAISVFNAGTGVVYATVDGTSPSAANCAFALPSGMGFNSITHNLVTSLKLYSTGTASAYVAY